MAMESRMTSGVRVAAAGAVVMALLLGAKVDQAVAVPMSAVCQTAATRITAPLDEKANLQAGAAQETDADPAVAPVVEPHVAVVPATKVVIAPPDPMPDPRPEPEIAVVVDTVISPAVKASLASINTNVRMPRLFVEGFQSADRSASPKGLAYLDAMRQAGYPLDLNDDLNTLVALKSLGVTPEYAKSMAGMGMGKPTVHDLIALKSLGVTPEYAAAMKQKGFATQNVRDLVALKAQGLTLQYAGWMKQQFPQATSDEVRRAAMFHLDEKFIAAAKAHGFDGKNLDKLLRLRMSGLLDE
jgi:hypothetical protein